MSHNLDPLVGNLHGLSAVMVDRYGHQRLCHESVADNSPLAFARRRLSVYQVDVLHDLLDVHGAIQVQVTERLEIVLLEPVD